MTVTTKVLNSWRMMYEHGDIAAILNAGEGKEGFTRYKIRNAINAGRGHFVLMDTISRYYKRKEKQQSKITV